jgi:enediyne polyketide synthase
MNPAIAIVALACRYPDARSPLDLWENVLSQRRAFRRIPAVRLRAEDYISTRPDALDTTYVGQAAVIEGYEFDRVRYRVAGTTFQAADLAHWLALDIAGQALAAAGYPDGAGLPRETTGVIVGNTLTGEFSRASTLRLRWPYTRRVLEAALDEQGWPLDRRQEFLSKLEAQYKAPFPPMGEESLAGGLSNTIAGRICNHFDLKGGGYTVDGACASSLLAVTTACTALLSGDLDVALAGGVDLSLDPFELVGFARTGALATDDMRVYDARSAGFWPGEGCGFVVLMRHEDALAQGRHIYALIRGWGISSDGSGGITRPEAAGQALALQRAYRRAGFGIETVAYFEGHGTGTTVGDATELTALTQALRDAGQAGSPVAIGSVKANIGHTKAAAGIAGLIKATMVLNHQVLPPTTGCQTPHTILAGPAPQLRVLSQVEAWPAGRSLRASVNAMGFGGINTHVVLEGAQAATPRKRLSLHAHALGASAQDAELFLFAAPDADQVRQGVEGLWARAPYLSRAELADAAAHQAGLLEPGLVRGAVVARTPADLASGLATLVAWLAEPLETHVDPQGRVFLGRGGRLPRLAFLFPGQASPAHLGGGAWSRRFDFVQDLYEEAGLPAEGNGVATEIAQPAIVTASLAGLRVLEHLGLQALLGIGHSVGELAALYWAGALDAEALLRIAAERGRAMATFGHAAGAMASIQATDHEVKQLLNGSRAVIACFNAPRQTVVSGEARAVAEVVAAARDRGWQALKLPVSHAFHSPLIADAAGPLAACLAGETFSAPVRTVISTVTGQPLTADSDLRAILCEQVTAPVRFVQAMAAAAGQVDLWIEVGPGRVLTGLGAEAVEAPVMATDSGGSTLHDLLRVAGAAFALGAPLDYRALFAGRFVRPFDLGREPRFFANPCELAPISQGGLPTAESAQDARSDVAGATRSTPPATSAGQATIHDPVTQDSSAKDSPLQDSLTLVRKLVAARAELPASAVRDHDRLLSDLHLNSITVSQLIAEAARCRNLLPPVSPTDFANATVAQLAQALDDLAEAAKDAGSGRADEAPLGVDTWFKAFTVELVERPLAAPRPQMGQGAWQVIALAGDPLAGELERSLAQAGGRGVAVCLPPVPDEGHIPLLLAGARALLQAENAGHFLLVQHDGGGAAFARTVYMELDGITTCVVDVPAGHPSAADLVAAEAIAADGYVEAHYDHVGMRRVPVLRLLPEPLEPSAMPVEADDVLLVTAGGKGIVYECALALAQQSGAALALLGRSRPEDDTVLASNLDRVRSAGIRFQYLPADVTDAEAVREAVRQAEAALGPITGVLHGAGINVPRLLRDIDEAKFRGTVATKVQGAGNVLAAVDQDRLRLFITFGSIIARIGLMGEADYAVANEWQTRLTERFQAAHPDCRCLALEWSVWSGAGMAERLGRVDTLLRQGITPIPVSEGTSLLGRLLIAKLPAVACVLSGRYAEAPALPMERREVPFLRFLEKVRLHYLGIELIVEDTLSLDSDPYLADHVFEKAHVLPAVMGLEAMAQVAMALAETTEVPIVEDVEFSRPVIVPEDAPLTIRLAALVRAPGVVEVVLRSEETGFQADHFRALCRFGQSPPVPAVTEPGVPAFPPLAMNPGDDLYGGLFFHGGRFRRVAAYHELNATTCAVVISGGDGAGWFARFLPGALCLGDPGAHDAAIHALQACVPQQRLLPTGLEQLAILMPARDGGPRRVYARERSHTGNTFVYDLEVTDMEGHLQERWRGLTLRAVGGSATDGPWPAPLLAPYVERRLQELWPGAAVRVSLDVNGHGDRRAASTLAMQRALGQAVPIGRLADGRPVAEGGPALSAAHAGEVVLAAAGSGPLGCDLEPVEPRPAAAWADLLGGERSALAQVIAHEAQEDFDTAATRVWGAAESLKKAGAVPIAPLTLAGIVADGWVLLASGAARIATYPAEVKGSRRRLMLAILTKENAG